MALNITKRSLLGAIKARTYAHAAPVSGITNYDIKTTVSSNKLAICSAENDSPICRISIQFKAGSRNETPDNSGATHVLRIAAGLSTRNNSQFGIIRNIQQVGASLSCMADRETVAYTLEGTREAVEKVLPFLTEVATRQVFKPWEVADNIPRLRYELAIRPPQQRAIDLLHKAAYRTGLGNSIYISKHQMGKISSETLQHYVATNFKSGRAAVVGLGIDHNILSQYAQSLELEGGEGNTNPSPYKGGEIRSDKGGDYAFVAMGFPSSGMENKVEATAATIVARALGTEPLIKYTNGSGILSRANGPGNHATSAFQFYYSDGGLFGALVAAEAGEAGKLVETTLKTLKEAKITDEDVNRGKNIIKREMLNIAESGSEAINLMGLQALYGNEAMNFNEVANFIDSISTNDCQSIARKMTGGKMSIAAVGNLRTVPFLDQLK